MNPRGIRIAAVLLVGLGVLGPAGPALVAQAAPQVAAQIIPPDQEDDFVKGAVNSKAPGLVAPKVTRQIDPKYTVSAMRTKVSGDVKLQAIIGVDGQIEKARVTESLHPELDAEALKTMDQWKFEPGKLNGVPVRVLVEVMMTFRMRR